MTYRWVEHTAELGLEVEAKTEERVFAEAMQALAELLDGGPGDPAEQAVRVAAADRGALLVAWLEELLYLADTDGFVPERAEIELGEALDATVGGRLARPRPLVKAVTYHGLEYARGDRGWRAKVVLDV